MKSVPDRSSMILNENTFFFQNALEDTNMICFHLLATSALENKRRRPGGQFMAELQHRLGLTGLSNMEIFADR